MIKLILHDYGYRRAGEENLSSDQIDISKCFDYEDDIEVLQTREGINGVFVEISIPQTLYKEAYTVIRNLFEQYQMFAYSRLSVYRRDRIDVNKYTLLDTFELDFSSLQITDYSLDIDIVKLDIQQLLNSNGNTKYDIKVSDFLNRQVLGYQRMNLVYSRDLNVFMDGEYTVPQLGSSSTYGGLIYPAIQVISRKSELDGSTFIVSNVEESGFLLPNRQTARYFFTNKSSQIINVTVRYKFNAGYIVTSGMDPSPIIRFVRGIGRGEVDFDQIVLSPFDTAYEGVFTAQVPASGSSGTFGIAMVISAESTSASTVSLNISQMEYFSIEFTVAEPNSPLIQGVTPGNLLGEIVNRMANQTAESTSGYGVNIAWTEEDSPDGAQPLLFAAETIRGFGNDAYFHTSFNDFEKWMRSLGYVPVVIDPKTLYFYHYEYLFQQEVRTSIQKKDSANLELIANSRHTYTSIKTGYPEQNYDSENGRFSINGTFEYSTGLILKDENVLDLTSPYRGDQIGLELLLFDRVDSTSEEYNSTDNKSDNDIFAFMVNTMASGFYGAEVHYAENPLVRTYDSHYNPRALAERWSKYLGVSSALLKFESTTANRNALLTDLYSDLALPERLFAPVTLKIDCAYIEELYNTDAWRNQVQFIHGNRMYKGFLSNSLRTFGKETSSTLELFASADSVPDFDRDPPVSPIQSSHQLIVFDNNGTVIHKS